MQLITRYHTVEYDPFIKSQLAPCRHTMPESSPSMISSTSCQEALAFKGESLRPHVCTSLVRHDGSLGEFLN